MATCQVCGRQIKATTGLIAHHGYRRPFEGWQTASCEGARYVPYEVSCERLREVTSMTFDFIVRQEKALADFEANPPQTITVTEKRGAWSKEETKVYERPEDFNPKRYYGSIPRTYENAYRNRTDNHTRTIRIAKFEFATMQRRLAEWKPVTAEA